MTRIFGKPFMLTEFNWTYPNAYRGEMGIIVPGYSAMQGWNGIFLYECSHGDEDEYLSESPGRLLELSKDPLSEYSTRIGSFLFLRGDVSESKIAFPLYVDDSCVSASRELRGPRVFRSLGVIGKVGSIATNGDMRGLTEKIGSIINIEKKLPDTVKNIRTVVISQRTPTFIVSNEIFDYEKCIAGQNMDIGVCDIEKKYARSSTGELEMNGTSKIFLVKTTRSEAFVFGSGGILAGDIGRVENSGAVTTLFMTSLGGSSLKKSRNILIFHLTESVCNGLTFIGRERKIVTQMGRPPYLIRRGRATITLNLEAFSSWSMFELDFRRNRIKETKLKPDSNGQIQFLADGFIDKIPK